MPAPSPTLPRKRGRGRTEFVARTSRSIADSNFKQPCVVARLSWRAGCAFSVRRRPSGYGGRLRVKRRGLPAEAQRAKAGKRSAGKRGSLRGSRVTGEVTQHACEACCLLLRSRRRASRRSTAAFLNPGQRFLMRRSASSWQGIDIIPGWSPGPPGNGVQGRPRGPRSGLSPAPEVSGPNLQPVPPARPPQAMPRESAPRWAG